MNRLASASALLLVASAAHAASLDLGARYGNANGCKFPAEYSSEGDDMLLLEEGEVMTFATSCEFLQVLPASGDSRVVTVLCSHEGEEIKTASLMRIDRKADADAYLVYDADGTLWGEVARCP